MVSPSVITLTILVTSMATVILSMQSMDKDVMMEVEEQPIPDLNALVADMVDKLENEYPDMQAQGRSFTNLFNLSAVLANAPNNTAAFTKIPLITLLFGGLSGGFGG